MTNLKDTHPTAHQQLLSGDFVAQRHQRHGFAGTACNQVTEQTANHDSKTKGGISGFSLNKGAVHRWTLTQHERAAITLEYKTMAGQCSVSHLYSELDSARMQRDQAGVMNITATVQNMVNPFDPLLDGDSVARDLLGAKQKGVKALAKFCETRIITAETSFYDPIKKMKMKTFKDTGHSTSTKIKEKEITLKSHCNLFARLIVVGNVRQISTVEMLTYSLGPLPQSLADFDGSLVKTNKAKLMHTLEEDINPPPTVRDIPDGSVWIWDAMALSAASKATANI